MNTKTRTRDGHWRVMKGETGLLYFLSALFCEEIWLRGPATIRIV
jgi:hypothetical protein